MKPLLASFAAALALAGLQPAAAQERAGAWQVLTYSDDEEWSARWDSLVVGTDSGAKTARVDGRMLAKKTGHVDLVRWSVTAADCNADAGKLVTSDMTGRYVLPFEFTKGGGTFESITAQAICRAYFNANK